MSVAIVLAGACTDSRQGKQIPTKPSFSQGSEDGVTGDVYREAALRLGDSTVSYSLGDTTVYAPIVAGWAYANSELGVSNALGVTTEGYQGSGQAYSGADSTTDSLGNMHTVAFSAPVGKPPTHIQAFINGELFMDQTVLWYREGDVWYMTEAYTEVYANGDTLSIWTSSSGQIASIHGSPFSTLKNVALAPARLALIPVRALAPQPLEAQWWSCRLQWIEYLAAVGVAKLAVLGAIAAPNPATIEGAILAVGLAAALGEQLVQCMRDS